MIKITRLLSSVVLPAIKLPLYLRLKHEPALMSQNIYLMGSSVVANLSMKESKKDGVHIIRVGGRLDATSAPLLGEKLVNIIEIPGAKLVVDFKDLNYLSSAGMRVMLAASKRLANLKGSVIFSSVQDSVMDIIKLAGFENIFHFSPSESIAIKKMVNTEN